MQRPAICAVVALHMHALRPFPFLNYILLHQEYFKLVKLGIISEEYSPVIEY